MKKCLLIFGLLVALIACTKKPQFDKEIQSVGYAYGGYPGEYYEYILTTKDGALHFIAIGENGAELDINVIVDENVLAEFKELFDNSTLEKWKGFKMDDINVSDGFSFMLEIVFVDGDTLSAYGHEHYPPDFKENHDLLVQFFEDLVSKVTTE